MERPANKTMTVNPLGAQAIESIGNEVYDAECLKLMNEYFYGVRIYPGQDPTHVSIIFIEPPNLNTIFSHLGLRRVGNDTVSLA